LDRAWGGQTARHDLFGPATKRKPVERRPQNRLRKGLRQLKNLGVKKLQIPNRLVVETFFEHRTKPEKM